VQVQDLFGGALRLDLGHGLEAIAPDVVPDRGTGVVGLGDQPALQVVVVQDGRGRAIGLVHGLARTLTAGVVEVLGTKGTVVNNSEQAPGVVVAQFALGHGGLQGAAGLGDHLVEAVAGAAVGVVGVQGLASGAAGLVLTVVVGIVGVLERSAVFEGVTCGNPGTHECRVTTTLVHTRFGALTVLDVLLTL